MKELLLNNFLLSIKINLKGADRKFIILLKESFFSLAYACENLKQMGKRTY